MNVRITPDQKKVKLDSPGSIARIMQEILLRENRLSRAQEHFWVVGLNNADKILFIELIGLGRQNRVAANPPDVFRMAIYKLAIKLVLVHNHPSGDLHISRPDRDITDRMLKVGEILRVAVTDHIIISETHYTSLQELGLIDEMLRSDTWRLLPGEEKEMLELKEQMLREEGLQQGKIEVAKKLKAKGMSDQEIKELTGLKISVVRKL